jgi:spermidine/putrescine transport system permease protein
MSGRAPAEDERRTSRPGTMSRLGTWLSNPWAKARFLWIVGIAYVVWTLFPVFIAVAFSFNAGKAQTTWQGFSLTRWYVSDVNSVWQDTALRSALFQSLKLSVLVVLIAVPFGVFFALGLDRWRGRVARSADFTMLFSFITPEIAIGVGLFLLFTQVIQPPLQGLPAQVLGLSMYEMAYAVIIVRARLLSIGHEFEEAAMDLGASPLGALRRVLMPLLSPAIFASVAIVFAASIDNFVISQRLCASASCQTIPIIIYASARRSPLPSLNALASITLFASTIIIAAAAVAVRRAAARERGQTKVAIPI